MLPTLINLTDIHIGTPRVSAEAIVDRLKYHLFPLLPDTDIVFCNGDMVDMALSMVNQNSQTFLGFFIELLRKAEEHNVVIRLLKGTDSHDRTQLEHIVNYREKGGMECDLRYLNTLTLEEIQPFGLKVAYIPENLSFPNAEAIIDQIQELMKQLGWKQLDVVNFHGYFKHLLPRGMVKPPKITFEAKMFDTILNPEGYVLCGHVHTKSRYKRILYSGSWDRDRHGEEESKGFWFIKNGKPKFIVNDHATPFLTINLTGYDDPEDCIVKYKRWVNKRFNLDIIGYVRVLHNRIDIRRILRGVTEKEFPNLKYSHDSQDSVDRKGIITRPTYRPEVVKLSMDNLPTITFDFMTERDIVGSLNIDDVKTLFNELDT